jgi:Fuc2NAc and GlcNAc transferase
VLVPLIFISALLSWLGVNSYRDWSVRLAILDLPNERSSHTNPTPRGAGLVVALICLSYFTGIFLWRGTYIDVFYLAGAVLICLVSWLDDIKHVSAFIRFPLHVLAAGIAIAGFGYFDNIFLPGSGTIILGRAGTVFTILWIVWLTNAYNFMDGVDGIAGSQAVVAGVGFACILYSSGARTWAAYSLVIAGSATGFLIHNWSPAKVFLGDIGSAFLGYTFALLPLMARDSARPETNSLLLFATLLLWPFLFDSVFTLFRRAARGERVWEAHRNHLYQELVKKGWKHSQVSGLYAGLAAAPTVPLCVFVKFELAEKYPGLVFGGLFLFVFIAAGTVIYLVHARAPAV